MADVFVEPTWAIVELFGHSVIAGLVTSVQVAGTEMLRVDVPEMGEAEPGFTKFYGGGAIYAISPTDEATARAAVERLRPRPVTAWMVQSQALPEPDDEDW